MTLTWILTAVLVGAASASVVRLAALHPIQMWLIPWAAVFLLYAPNLLGYIELGPRTIALVAAATAAFCAGTLLGERIVRGSAIAGAGHLDERQIERAALLAFGAMLVLLVAFVVQVAAAYGVRAAFVASPEVRLDLGGGLAAITIKYLYFAYAAAALCGIAAARARTSRHRRAYASLMVLSAAAQYFSTGRSNIVLCVAVGLIAYGLARPEPLSKRRLVTSGAMLVALAIPLFLGMGALLQKSYTAQDVATYQHFFNDHDDLRFLGTPYQYATAPLPALDVVVSVTPDTGRAGGCATLATACSALASLGIPAEAEPKLSAFTGRPMAWNTFTALYAPLVDVGPYLASLILLIIGLVVGGLWSLGWSGGAVGIALYAPIATSVAYSIIENNLLAPHFIGAALIAAGALAVTARVGRIGRTPW